MCRYLPPKRPQPTHFFQFGPYRERRFEGLCARVPCHLRGILGAMDCHMSLEHMHRCVLRPRASGICQARPQTADSFTRGKGRILGWGCGVRWGWHCMCSSTLPDKAITAYQPTLSSCLAGSRVESVWNLGPAVVHINVRPTHTHTPHS